MKKAPFRFGVVVQLVRTLACHARGRGFEPRRPRHEKNHSIQSFPSRYCLALILLPHRMPHQTFKLGPEHSLAGQHLT